jgi:hypothetical protein
MALSLRDGDVQFVLGFSPDLGSHAGDLLTYANAKRSVSSIREGARILDSLEALSGTAGWSSCTDDMDGLTIEACRRRTDKGVLGRTVTTTIGHILVPRGSRFVLLIRELK